MTTPVTVNPATDKQIAFLTKLIATEGLAVDIPDSMTTKQASALINSALEAKAARKAARTSLVAPTPVSLVKTPVVDPEAKKEAVIEALEAALAVLRSL